ncbi:MAG: glycosyltransferase family 39 protein [Planctomycetes bacterium]|nr:glycosyltransferase family 39 protein [Planctomycetota bacterium]MBI3844975.1 glycosyltransferase family 39 protein [Planctomycetota bacterium]
MIAHEDRKPIAALLALSFVLFFVGIAHYDLDLKAEPREGITAWETIHGDHWYLPKLNGELLPEKPLVFPWLVAGSCALFGEGSTFSARLPSAVMATLLVLVVFGIGKRLLGRRGGFLAALFTATTALVISLARRSRVDMTLTFFVCLAIYLFLREYQRGESNPESRPSLVTALLFWIALALATLTKGPLGAILPGITIGSFLLARRKLSAVRRLRPLIGVPVYLVVAGSWYAQGFLRGGDEFAYRSFMMENLLMFIGNDEGGGHIHGFFYLWPYFFSNGIPWSLFVPAAIALGVKRRQWRADRFLLPLLWLAAMLLFFSIARGKRSDYLLPLLPAAALLAAGLWDAWIAEPRNAIVKRFVLASSAVAGIVCAAALLVLALFLFIPASSWPESLTRSREAASAFEIVRALMHRPSAVILFGASTLFIGIVPFALTWRGRPVPALLSTATGVAAAALLAAFEAMPKVQDRESLKPLAQQIEATVPRAAPLYNHDAFEWQVMYYTRRRIPTLDDSGFARFLADPNGGYCLLTRGAYDDLEPAARQNLEIALRATRPYSDPREQHLVVKRIPPRANASGG